MKIWWVVFVQKLIDQEELHGGSPAVLYKEDVVSIR